MELNDIDLALLAKTSENDDAFAVLVRRHQAKLRAFLIKLSGDQSIADDIAQNSFIKAHNAIGGFAGGGSFRSWLFAIAYREYLQHIRKEKSGRRLEQALKAERDGMAQHESDTMQSSMRIDLQRGLARLEEKERAAVLLCDAAGLSHREASLALDTPLGSIKTYVARAREKLRDFLSTPPNDNSPTGSKEYSDPQTHSLNGATHAVR